MMLYYGILPMLGYLDSYEIIWNHDIIYYAIFGYYIAILNDVMLYVGILGYGIKL